MAKLVIIFGLLIIAGVGVWWSGVWQMVLPQEPVAEQQATTTPQQQTNQQPAAVNDLPTQTTDTSDAALVQDSTAIDAQIQALTTDSSQVDGSMNDKPVTQEF